MTKGENSIFLKCTTYLFVDITEKANLSRLIQRLHIQGLKSFELFLTQVRIQFIIQRINIILCKQNIRNSLLLNYIDHFRLLLGSHLFNISAFSTGSNGIYAFTLSEIKWHLHKSGLCSEMQRRAIGKLQSHVAGQPSSSYMLMRHILCVIGLVIISFRKLAQEWNISENVLSAFDTFILEMLWVYYKLRSRQYIGFCAQPHWWCYSLINSNNFHLYAFSLIQLHTFLPGFKWWSAEFQ